jgi:hypothetical protein
MLRELVGGSAEYWSLRALPAVERATTAIQGIVDRAMLLTPLIAATAGCISRGRQTMG